MNLILKQDISSKNQSWKRGVLRDSNSFFLHCLFNLLLSILLVVPGYSEGGSKVEILKTDTGYQLQVNGESFYIKGAGIDDHYDVLAASGGNSIRTWGVGKWEEVFEMAEQYNLYVCAGIWLGQELVYKNWYIKTSI